MTVTEKRVYLASRSPRRRELLKQIGVAFEILLLREDLRRGADVDETPLPGERPQDYVLRIARAKAAAGARQVASRGLPPNPVLAADTAVVLGGEIIGKPADAEHAVRMLMRLSGRRHEVVTAVALARGDRLESRLSASTVEFGDLAEAEVRRYAACGEPLDKAGAYAIQGRAGAFIREIRGSYSGVVGLPLCETAELLRRFGIAII